MMKVFESAATEVDNFMKEECFTTRERTCVRSFFRSMEAQDWFAIWDALGCKPGTRTKVEEALYEFAGAVYFESVHPGEGSIRMPNHVLTVRDP